MDPKQTGDSICGLPANFQPTIAPISSEFLHSLARVRRRCHHLAGIRNGSDSRIIGPEPTAKNLRSPKQIP